MEEEIGELIEELENKIKRLETSMAIVGFILGVLVVAVLSLIF